MDKAFTHDKPEESPESGRDIPGYKTATPNIYSTLRRNAKNNRGAPTDGEAVLWEYLRNKRTGYKFRRQHAIYDYIADFICLSEGLIIEVDGGIHDNPQQAEHDKLRTEMLNSLGYDVLRFSNNEVIENPRSVVDSIISYIQ